MPFRANNPQFHDHTDGDLIVITASKLSYHLHSMQKFLSSGTGLTWFGNSAAFGIAAVVTEKFRNLGPVNGDTIRALFIMLGLVFLGIATSKSWHWFKHKNKYDPEQFAKNLLTESPMSLNNVIAKVISKKNSSKN